jgi:predicted dinucleotide-binding enzyme
VKVGIFGKGKVGLVLSQRMTGAGHEVKFGIRHPVAEDDLSMHDAVAWADLLVLSVPFMAAEEVARSLGDFGGKVLVDLTNPVKPTFDGLMDLPESAGELVAKTAQNARVVKAFNTIGVAVMENPTFGDVAATLMIAGDDVDAKAQVSELARSIGFDPVDAGGISMSHYLEAMAWMWINQAVRQGAGHGFVFQLVRRPD